MLKSDSRTELIYLHRVTVTLLSIIAIYQFIFIVSLCFMRHKGSTATESFIDCIPRNEVNFEALSLPFCSLIKFVPWLSDL